MEDDGIMLQVYENTQDEIRAKNKLINKYKDKVSKTLSNGAATSKKIVKHC